jgi:hypothetical protein
MELIDREWGIKSICGDALLHPCPISPGIREGGDPGGGLWRFFPGKTERVALENGRAITGFYRILIGRAGGDPPDCPFPDT